MAEYTNGHDGPKGNGKRPRRQAERDQLFSVATSDGCELIHFRGEAFASFTRKGHQETHPVRSAAVGRWLRSQYRKRHNRIVSKAALKDVAEMLDAEALEHGRECPVHVRVARLDGCLYIDLGDPSRQVAKIDENGWAIIEAADSQVRFLRPEGIQALPEPKPDGRLETLARYLNVASEEVVLAYSWLIAAFWPSGPYAILLLIAEQGAGKSSFMRALRRLIDPHIAMIRTLPASERDLMISAKNSRVLALDNVSSVPPWLSDALCQIATGGGFASRKLWTDSDEAAFEVQRPIMLNGIADLASRPDLANRALVLRLPRIEKGQRQSEAEFWTAFEHELPYILGAVFDVLSGVLRRIEDVKLDELPRMADFARLGVAAEPDLPVEPGSFMRAYWDNQAGLTKAAVENDPFIAEIVAVAHEDGPWEGTATQLRDAILNRCSEDQRCDNVIPSSPNAVSSRLRRFLPALRAEGIEVTLDCSRKPGTGDRLIQICVIDQN